jgi:hypothetical protein
MTFSVITDKHFDVVEWAYLSATVNKPEHKTVRLSKPITDELISTHCILFALEGCKLPWCYNRLIVCKRRLYGRLIPPPEGYDFYITSKLIDSVLDVGENTRSTPFVKLSNNAVGNGSAWRVRYDIQRDIKSVKGGLN